MQFGFEQHVFIVGGIMAGKRGKDAYPRARKLRKAAERGGAESDGKGGRNGRGKGAESDGKPRKATESDGKTPQATERPPRRTL